MKIGEGIALIIRHYPLNCVNNNAKKDSIVKFKD